MLEVDDGLLTEYLAESREQLAIAESDLLAVEKDGKQIDEERMNRIFRVVHTVKGGAGFFDLHKIGELAHHAENVLDLMRSGNLLPVAERITVLLRAVDCLTAMVSHPATSNATDIETLVEALGLMARSRIEDRGTENTVEIASSAPLRILIVEDDFTNRVLLQNFLSQFGSCHFAVNGVEAVSAFEQALNQDIRYDLVCMDIRMPEMNGRQAVRRMRTIEQAKGILSSRGAKIIMVSSIGDIREVFRCFEELCDAYLVKPIDLSQLRGHLLAHHLVRSS